MTTKQKVYEVTRVSLAILESHPPKLAITLAGNCNTSGWKTLASNLGFTPSLPQTASGTLTW